MIAVAGGVASKVSGCEYGAIVDAVVEGRMGIWRGAP